MIKPETGAPEAAQRPMRADARRNYDRLLVAARDAFTAYGADASLDDIARNAGVGNATLYRHFPSREALLDAVFRDRVQTLCAQAEELLGRESPHDALVTWLRALVVHVTTYRGLAAWLMSTATGQEQSPASCQELIRAAGKSLLVRAQQSGAVRPDIGTSQLLRFTHAIALATEETPGEADQLLSLVMDGLRMRTAPPPAFSPSDPSAG
ncbi:TetR/AcrR family transcriptional regulator [Actinoallomurus iriomotensis]|uniref:TetR family transcriptional regulator n=1 Tax=Actinoallomurus iriomotensis TaxID=478107 RepID=A0A9W6RD05_9ACTN|nr:TetR/AcrR family transcriptional regulator [Actinoallomurus iriomotensis]GLY73594.1 TetR family transcriptional regulator [Actinoallomurus iriomotensis]